jgi:hypothetical protein
LDGFFHQIKERQQKTIGREDSIQAVCLREFCMKQQRTLNSFQKFKIKLKNLKHIAVNVLLSAYPMALLSG